MKVHIFIIEDENRLWSVLGTPLSLENYRLVSFMNMGLQFESSNRMLRYHSRTASFSESLPALLFFRFAKDNATLTPVVMITGNRTIDNASENVRPGAFYYLRKPVEKDDLLKVVNTALNYKKLIEKQQYLENELKRQKYCTRAL